MNEFINLSQEEMDYVSQLVSVIKDNCSGVTAQEKMINFLLKSYPEMPQENAKNITNCILETNAKFTQYLNDSELTSKNWFYSKINTATSKLSLSEKYSYLFHILIALRSVDTQMVEDNLKRFTFNAVSYYENMKNRNICIDSDITEKAVDELMEELEHVLDNSSIIILGNSEVASLLENPTEEAVIEFMDGNWSDSEFKSFASLAIYAAYQNGQLTSLTDDITPESITVGVCAGVEKSKVILQASKGKILWEEAFEILKLIGRVAVTVLLIAAAAKLAVTIALAGGIAMEALLGSSIIGFALGTVIGGYLGIKLAGVLYEFAQEAVKATVALSSVAVTAIIEGYHVVKDWTVSTLLPKTVCGLKTALNFISNCVEKGLVLLSDGIEKLKNSITV